MVARFGGQVIKISPTSDQYINPMDINMNYSEDDNLIALKANETGSIYHEDIEELRTAQKEILQEMRKVLEKLTAIM